MKERRTYINKFSTCTMYMSVSSATMQVRQQQPHHSTPLHEYCCCHLYHLSGWLPAMENSIEWLPAMENSIEWLAKENHRWVSLLPAMENSIDWMAKENLPRFHCNTKRCQTPHCRRWSTHTWWQLQYCRRSNHSRT